MIGYAAFDAGGLLWREVHGAIIPYSLPHRGQVIEPREAKRILKESGAYLIRWESSFDMTAGGSWWHLIKDSAPDISTLGAKARNQVRRGLREYRIERCSRDVIVEKGYAVYAAAYERYETFERQFGMEEFAAAVLAMPDSIEFWAVFDRHKGELAGFGENIVDGGACFYSTMWFRPEALRNYASYALIHVMNNHYLAERGFRYVSDGARNISHDTGIHRFLEQKFGFRRAYCRLHIVYSPLVGLAVKLLFPFRKVVSRLTRSSRFEVLMRQEELRRRCGEEGR